MNSLTDMTAAAGGLVAVLGYAVVFLGLAMLMLVVMALGRAMTGRSVKTMPEPVKMPASAAPGAAGELMLYDTDARDAAMIMAIVADAMGAPLNELRFMSIREVKKDEI